MLKARIAPSLLAANAAFSFADTLPQIRLVGAVIHLRTPVSRSTAWTRPSKSAAMISPPADAKSAPIPAPASYSHRAPPFAASSAYSDPPAEAA